MNIKSWMNKQCICGNLMSRNAKKCLFCAIKCRGGKNHGMYIDGRTLKKRKCVNCHEEITIGSKLGRCKSCSRKGKLNPLFGTHYFVGKNNPMYREIGTVRNQSGYRYIKISDNAWIPEHRFLIEKYLQRNLQKTEIIHHIDGNKKNNKLSNLYLFRCQATHNDFESLIRHKIIDRFILKSNLNQIKNEKKY